MWVSGDDAIERGQIGGFSQKWMRIHTRVDANGFETYRSGCDEFWREHGIANVLHHVIHAAFLIYYRELLWMLRMLAGLQISG
jgi:hypothetical protein